MASTLAEDKYPLNSRSRVSPHEGSKR